MYNFFLQRFPEQSECNLIASAFDLFERNRYDSLKK